MLYNNNNNSCQPQSLERSHGSCLRQYEFAPNVNKLPVKFCACVGDSAHILAASVCNSSVLALGDNLFLFMLEEKNIKKFH